MNFTGVTFTKTKHSSEVVAGSQWNNKHFRIDLITSLHYRYTEVLRLLLINHTFVFFFVNH